MSDDVGCADYAEPGGTGRSRCTRRHGHAGKHYIALPAEQNPYMQQQVPRHIPTPADVGEWGSRTGTPLTYVMGWWT